MSAAACLEFSAPYSLELLPFLEYPGDWYIHCTSDTIVNGSLLEVNGGHASAELAELFQVQMRNPATWPVRRDLEIDEMFVASLHAIAQRDVTAEVAVLRTLLHDNECRLMFNPQS